MAVIRIIDLKARAIIGTHPWERKNKQEIMINITIEYDAAKASKSDKLQDALNYEAVANKVLGLVERSSCLLLEKLTAKALDIVMADKRVRYAVVRIDKPQAIALAKAVSFELMGERKEGKV
jgi:D-erythro-7,8-dihydroneopterin triphosphate epimerase